MDWYPLYLYALFGSTLYFLQQAAQIALDARVLRRGLRTVPVFWLALFSFLYSTLFFFTLHVHGPVIGYAVMCAIPIISSLQQVAYISSFKEHLRLPQRALRRTQVIFLLFASTHLAGWALWQLSGVELVQYVRPNPRVNPLVVKMGLAQFTPTPVTLLGALVFIGAMTYSQLKILGALRKQGTRDKVLVIGVLVSIVALINECASGMGFADFYSITFIADALQLYRISSLIRKEALLRVEALENDVDTLVPIAHLGLFVGAIAHDIRNPLTVIGSCNQVLEGHLAGTSTVEPAFADKVFESIRSSVRQMEVIVRQYLTLARSDEPVCAEPMYLKPIVLGAVERGRQRGRSFGNPTLEISVPEDLVISGNPVLLELLLTNLITDAAQAAGERPHPGSA